MAEYFAIQYSIEGEISLARQLASKRAREEYLAGPGQKRKLAEPGSSAARKARKMQSAYESRYRVRHHERELEERLEAARARVDELNEREQVLRGEVRAHRAKFYEKQNAELQQRNFELQKQVLQLQEENSKLKITMERSEQKELEALLEENQGLKVNKGEPLSHLVEEDAPLTPQFDGCIGELCVVEEPTQDFQQPLHVLPQRTLEYFPAIDAAEVDGVNPVQIIETSIKDKGHTGFEYRPADLPPMHFIATAQSA